jgi:hypothetical protein
MYKPSRLKRHPSRDIIFQITKALRLITEDPKQPLFLHLRKVLAHSGNRGNDKGDTSANEARRHPEESTLCEIPYDIRMDNTPTIWTLDGQPLTTEAQRHKYTRHKQQEVLTAHNHGIGEWNTLIAPDPMNETEAYRQRTEILLDISRNFHITVRHTSITSTMIRATHQCRAGALITGQLLHRWNIRNNPYCMQCPMGTQRVDTPCHRNKIIK